MNMRHLFRRAVSTLGIAFALLLIPIQPASAKGNFAKISIQLPDSSREIEMTDPAYLSFWTFSDFADGTRQAPHVVGPGYEVTRWSLSEDGTTYVPVDRLRYYHTSSENTLGRGWIYYEGLVNGRSWRNQIKLAESPVGAERRSAPTIVPVLSDSSIRI